MKLDKVLHATFSAALVMIFFGWLTFVFLFPGFTSVVVASVAALVIGAAKELLWDWALGNGDPSWGDFAADAVGVLIMTAIFTWAVLR